MRSATHFDAALDQLHSALKWLIGGAGATAAVVVAALQLGDLSSLHPVGAVLVAGAALVAVGVALTLLVAASRVLTLPQLTATELSNREMAPDVVSRAPGEPMPDELLKWIEERKTYLLGSAESVTDLYRDGLVAPRAALDEVVAGRETEWRGRKLVPGSESEELLAREIAHAEERLAHAERAVHFYRSREAYKKVADSFVTGGVVFGVSIAALVLVPVFCQAPAEAPITAPTTVTISIVSPGKANLPSKCAGDHEGVAIGGTWEHPVVMLPDTEGCAGRTFEAGDGVVVTPLLADGST